MVFISIVVALSSISLAMGQYMGPSGQAGFDNSNGNREQDGHLTGHGSNFDTQGYHNYDPNRLMNGFFPLWSIILLSMAGLCLTCSIISWSCFTLCGCRKDAGDFKKLKDKSSHSQILA